MSATNGVTRVAVLHLMNGFADSSITRIVLRLVQHMGCDAFSWHIGGLGGLGDVQDEFRRAGASVVDFSNGADLPGFYPARVRQYVREHHIQMIHSHTPRTILTAAVGVGLWRRPIHLATKHILYRPGDRRWGLAYMLLDWLSLYPPTFLVAVSETMQRQIAAFPGLGTSRMTVIRNAIDCDHYYVPDQRDSCRAEFGLTSREIVIGYAGRIAPAKRLNLLLEGFAAVQADHPQARLLIAGEGPQRPDLEAMAEQLGIAQAVIWAGFRKDIPRLLAAMDIFVQPSMNEGLSLSLLEAMVAGKSVVATDVGGTAEVVIDGMTGCLVPPGSASAIGKAIAGLLDAPEKRDQLARAGRERVVQMFDVQRMMDSYQQLYEALVSRLSGSPAVENRVYPSM